MRLTCSGSMKQNEGYEHTAKATAQLFQPTEYVRMPSWSSAVPKGPSTWNRPIAVGAAYMPPPTDPQADPGNAELQLGISQSIWSETAPTAATKPQSTHLAAPRRKSEIRNYSVTRASGRNILKNRLNSLSRPRADNSSNFPSAPTTIRSSYVLIVPIKIFGCFVLVMFSPSVFSDKLTQRHRRCVR